MLAAFIPFGLKLGAFDCKPQRKCFTCIIIMSVTIYNISSTSARVSWPASPTCLDTFYSVMYDPNWNSLLMGFTRKSFKHEERIPVSQTSTHLANLLPQTAYFLCVTCQAANPVRDQCQVFSTQSESSEGHDRASWELAVGVWLTCCLLLLVIAGVLLWGCLRNTCSVIPRRAADSCTVVANSTRQDASESGHLFTPRSNSEDSIKRATIIQPSLMSTQISGHVITQDHEDVR
ncbi:fibronectin type III domain-containing protein 9 [Austrofundulus limnaeus]|uniref:Fibronectin type III domain-containing protein 9 n=1 Tax=Austrofundulus limnaeus TaxID=52670 RepID=A0A2I4CD08_AUSLI|nr:PREDICTED: fibronectin type III domain-containing protein 9 [Austrofundulus limnaeus]